MKLRNSHTIVPDDLLEYDAARWTPLARDDENGGSMAYYRALRRDGLRDDICHMMRATACVSDLRVNAAPRLADGQPF